MNDLQIFNFLKFEEQYAIETQSLHISNYVKGYGNFAKFMEHTESYLVTRENR